MRENKSEHAAQWAADEAPRHYLPEKPLMCDKATDTSLDEESFKLIPCTCQTGDSDSNISCADQSLEYTPRTILRECFCFQHRGKTLLDAVFTANFELLEICLNHDVDMNSADVNGDTALHMVSDRGDVDMLTFLLNLQNINVNAQNVLGFTPLSIAVLNSHGDAAELLLEHGADPNIPDNKGRTPICFSVHKGNESITRMLIANNADVNVVDAFGNTPLQEAIMNTSILTIVKVLLSNGANPLISTGRLNPFLEAVLDCTTNEKLEMIKILVESGVDINVLENYSNRNCLHLNAINGFLPLAEYLVNQGADLEQLDISGRTPYDVAAKHENEEVADFFLKAMCLRRVFFKERLKHISRSLRRLTMSAMFVSSMDLMRKKKS
ncbi:serine/threonine-protein phosphatase 6 regulatory ankyrin repeat subunit C-like isoform X1 [Harmonia axyridis]|uniref:serine/threonine-protein phosphatase 6 regulatory ankyrin repeat subunit C-like isoform X1 n=1 Tax=Harmonia axyridis TaxID=115357 RepID=UPI001E278B90|nr:serine/threonine-protein phosphatase 6 regulatory ankyrin repeat subunit C-like isoform X1 [Harmonia axyridis]